MVSLETVSKIGINLADNWNQKAVEMLLRVVILCTKQDNVLRGLNENTNSGNRGNSVQILDLIRSKKDETIVFFSKLPKYANYQSHKSKNELLNIVRDTIVQSIVTLRNLACFLSLLTTPGMSLVRTDVNMLSICEKSSNL